MIAMLIRSGHTNVLEYGYEFLKMAAEELDESMKNTVVDMAFATRAAGASNEDWGKFIKKSTPKTEKKVKRKMTKDDHSKNMAAIKSLSR